MRLPIYPVKGYSITVPIKDAAKAPVSTVMDETHKIAITRLGDRIRVGGMAEISGFSDVLPERRKRTLVHSVEDLFGGAGDQSRATFWSGLRPMTPDGTPILGRSSVRNLYLNTGHGTLGWTMAAGSGRVLADMMSGRDPEIDTADLGMNRYWRLGGRQRANQTAIQAAIGKGGGDRKPRPVEKLSTQGACPAFLFSVARWRRFPHVCKFLRAAAAAVNCRQMSIKYRKI